MSEGLQERITQHWDGRKMTPGLWTPTLCVWSDATDPSSMEPGTGNPTRAQVPPQKSLLGVIKKVSYQHAAEPIVSSRCGFLVALHNCSITSIFLSRGSRNKGPPAGVLQTTDLTLS